MARSPLILAASATAALPRTAITSVSALTENSGGRFDSALARTDDGREVVVRMPANDEAAADLAAESRALHALTAGVRALLPFSVPEVLGEAGSGMQRVLVVDHIDGYRIDPAHLPKGPGYAPAIGGALAAVHALPVSIVRTDGLPVRSPERVRDDVERLLDRADATGRVGDDLMMRWRRALEVDDLWRFESAVILGGATSSSVVLVDDEDDAPHVVGILDWAGLSVGDPAVDLRWLASSPLAADDVHAGYAAAGERSPDPLLRERARLYAELEFARWLVHGHDAGESDVVADAVALLDALADGVRGDHIVPDSRSDIDDALALVESVPPVAAPAVVDTSMQTDAYDPEALSLYLSAERDRVAAAEALAEALDTADPDADTGAIHVDQLPTRDDVDPEETAPLDLDGWDDGARESMSGVASRTSDVAGASATPDTDGETPLRQPRTSEESTSTAVDDEEDAARASRAALRRWGVSDDTV
ncbi:Predicted kinase, aminoglycoside phosphotransferase (APT) family [Microbacterium sp. ru370.1]|uniref:phosphotransferase n=1 Tax=unclassified Microbacterium TaxID=2609290 RepID=UPI000883E424|nr:MULTISPECIES: phosphotransferase [unclassified Microbacterium]SDO83307.1 Predicted kinase, aminoglycoside phosphotransferase (APT) family [Microbacterium sp. ru370.1]SIT90153.1 Predicted kinase, aminoglycoside phosphotransferase (APT) family [Microbacterium sp. RU1D]